MHTNVGPESALAACDSLPSFQFVANEQQWLELRPKLAKWLCLCENYPYRMSFLVLVINDFVQKALVNRLRHTHPSHSKYRLVHYAKGGDKAATASATTDADDPSLELPDDMPIVEAYFRHVEQDIYSHPNARKMLSLDGDPVRFACGTASCGICPAARRLLHLPPASLSFAPDYRMTFVGH